MQSYLAQTEIVDWSHSEVWSLAKELGDKDEPGKIAARCFDWVRDLVRHSVDHRDTIVPVRASEVLRHRTGMCYAKSHLLVALLRANGIPAGFGYQRLSIDDQGPPFCLHGFVGVHLPNLGWYRIDPRGNKPGISTQFDPPREWLAYRPKLPGEQTFREVWPEPLPIVIQALQQAPSVEALLQDLPDWLPETDSKSR